MAYLLIVILDDLKVLPDLLHAWREAGVPGATILQSVGAYRAHTWLERIGLGALERLFEAEEIHRRTLLTAIKDEALLERAIAEAEQAVQDFERPNSGILLVLPVVEAKGLQKERPVTAIQEPAPPLVCADWRDIRVAEVVHSRKREPVIVRADAFFRLAQANRRPKAQRGDFNRYSGGAVRRASVGTDATGLGRTGACARQINLRATVAMSPCGDLPAQAGLATVACDFNRWAVSCALG